MLFLTLQLDRKHESQERERKEVQELTRCLTTMADSFKSLTLTLLNLLDAASELAPLRDPPELRKLRDALRVGGPRNSAIFIPLSCHC
jgi:hypothetical protein